MFLKNVKEGKTMAVLDSISEYIFNPDAPEFHQKIKGVREGDVLT